MRGIKGAVMEIVIKKINPSLVVEVCICLMQFVCSFIVTKLFYHPLSHFIKTCPPLSYKDKVVRTYLIVNNSLCKEA